MRNVFIVDDEASTRSVLENFLDKKGFDSQSFSDALNALESIKEYHPDLILSNINLPDMDGLEFIKKTKIFSPESQLIIVTDNTDVRSAVEIMKAGASDIITKPILHEKLLASVEAAIKRPAGTMHKKPIEDTETTNEFIRSISSKAKTLYKHLELVAPTDMTVVIHGETGVGKEFIARQIHNSSKRADRPFIAIDCGALTENLASSELFGHEKGAFTGASSLKKGSFELADSGTIFLDEIGNLSYENQVKLLRAIQERKIHRVGGIEDIEIDVRILAASNADLKEMIQEGTFREDLYHRLNEFSMYMPPIRERREDIKLYALQFIRDANSELDKRVEGFSLRVEEIFMNYHWPGNLRELKNVIKRAVLLTEGDEIQEEALPVELIFPYNEKKEDRKTANAKQNGDLKVVANGAEKELIIKTLQKYRNNKTKVANELNIDRKTLYNKLNEYNIAY